MRNRVLIADADPAFAGMLANALRQSGWSVACAADGAAVLRLLSAEAYDVLLLGPLSVEQTGCEVCEEVRSNPRFASLLILVLAVHEHDKAIAHALAVGADAYLVKPFSPGELLIRLRALLAPEEKN